MVEEPEIPDSQPPVDEQPVVDHYPNPRPAIVAATLEWAARMWLMDGDAADAHVFIGMAQEAFGQAVAEATTTDTR